MKRPSIELNGQVVADFMLRHAEKLVVTVVGLTAAWFAWEGVQAVRFKSVRPDQKPAAVRAGAEAARAHVAAVDVPPEGLLPAHESLATQLAGWRAARAESRDDLPLLDKPLVEDLARRPQPPVLPLDDLRAVAGLAVLSAPKADVGEPAPQGQPQDGGAAAPVAPEAGRPGARIVPYVVITGLVPFERQRGEYERSFTGVGFRDDVRDTPLWSDFEIDRGTVAGDGTETWQRIDLADAARRQAGGWTVMEADVVPPPYRLAEVGRNQKTTPVPFCGPLPTRIDEGWGPEQVHPSVLERIRVGDPSPPPQRMFRFIDTGVEPGKAYRYRVRLKVWNPNWRLDQKWLADPALAAAPVLASPDSAASAAVRIPDTLAMLVAPLAAEDAKRLKLRPGLFEVLVLAESAETGGYSLRSVLTELGGFIDVDETAGKPADGKSSEQRSWGEPIITGRVLIDVLGNQVDPADMPVQRPNKQSPRRRNGPDEPLEMIFLKPDGGVEAVSAADAQPVVQRYRETLPTTTAATKEKAEPGPPASPLDGSFNPFAQPQR